jgi:glucose-1-phosphate thymidylyltransferase
VHIADNVQISNSTVGPNVSIGAGSVIDGSTLTDTIVGDGSSIKSSTLRNSLIGDAAIVEGFEGELTVADHSEVRGVRS